MDLYGLTSLNIQALKFDLRRGTHSIGSHVRDAATDLASFSYRLGSIRHSYISYTYRCQCLWSRSQHPSSCQCRKCKKTSVDNRESTHTASKSCKLLIISRLGIEDERLLVLPEMVRGLMRDMHRLLWDIWLGLVVGIGIGRCGIWLHREWSIALSYNTERFLLYRTWLASQMRLVDGVLWWSVKAQSE